MEGHLQDICECHEFRLKYIFPVHVADVCIVQMVLLKVDYTILLSMAPFEFGKYLFILFIWCPYTYCFCRVSLWRNFIVVEENYWSLICQEGSHNPGRNCWKLLILMIMRRSSLLQHKLFYHTSEGMLFFACKVHACDFAVGERGKG